MTEPTVDIIYQIRARRDRLSPAELKTAEAILDDVEFAAAAGIEQLADKAGVSAAAMSRFAKSLGCDDIRDLRRRLAQASTVGARFLQQTPERGDSAFFNSIVGDIEGALRRQLAGFDEDSFNRAAALLEGARMIYAFGMGGCSTIFSAELQYRLVRLGLPIAASHDPVMMRLTGATLGPEHTVVAFSVTGLTPELLDVARLVKHYGANLVAITREGSPLAALADVLLPVYTAETDFIYKPTAARYGMLLAVDILATELALRAPDQSQELLRRVKLAMDDYRGGEDRLPLGD